MFLHDATFLSVRFLSNCRISPTLYDRYSRGLLENVIFVLSVPGSGLPSFRISIQVSSSSNSIVSPLLTSLMCLWRWGNDPNSSLSYFLLHIPGMTNLFCIRELYFSYYFLRPQSREQFVCLLFNDAVYIDTTRWFKYDRDAVRLVYTQISPGHIWITLYIKRRWRNG
jgi:hypothetical protein